MSSAKARGRKIAAETRALAQLQGEERVRYWAALLARPQLAGPIVHAVRLELDASGWSRKLASLVGYGRAMIETGRAWERDRYRRGCWRAAEWLANTDRRCGVANACHRGIGQWSARQLPGGCQWGARRFPKGRIHARTWQTYWSAVEQAKRAREQHRNRMVEINEGLAIMATAKWAPWAVGHLGENDLQQAAREGVMTAADLYECKRGIAFSTYAMWWMRHKLFREHQHARTDVRHPIGVQALALSLATLVTEHQQWGPEDVRERWDLEIEAKWETSKAKNPKAKRPRTPTLEAVKRAMEYLGHRELGLEHPSGRDQEGLSLAEVLSDQSEPIDDQLHNRRVLRRLAEALEQLPRAEREIVQSRYGLEGPERTAAQLARASRGTVVEIERTERGALERLREQLTG